MAKLISINFKDLNLKDPFMKALKAVNSISNDATSLTEEDLAKQRKSMERASKLATPPIGVATESFELDDMACEWVRPTAAYNKDVVILYAHGGGYTCGGLSYARILAAKLALSTGLAVMSFQYRLAPEHQYPAAFDDGMKAWDYLLHLGYGAKNIILSGDSAGGNLALCMTQELLAKSRFTPRALVLFSPWTDMTATNDSYEKVGEDDPILTYNYITSVRSAYIGENANPADPKYSPLYGQLSDFPPTLIQVGSHELLLDDSVKLAKKINKAGGNATLMEYEDGWHVFQQMPVPLAGRAMSDVGDYVSKILYLKG